MCTQQLEAIFIKINFSTNRQTKQEGHILMLMNFAISVLSQRLPQRLEPGPIPSRFFSKIKHFQVFPNIYLKVIVNTFSYH